MVGAGAAGVELTLSMQHALSTRAQAEGGRFQVPEFHLFGAAPSVLPTHNRSAQRRFARVLAERGVHVHLRARVARVDAARLAVRDGDSFPVDEIVWATAAAPPSWPAASGLAVDRAGFIAVDATLQSTSHPGVFAAGDVGGGRRAPAREGGRVRRPPGPAARGEPAAGAARRDVAALPSAAPLPEPDHLRRPLRRRLARPMVGRGRLGLALEGLDRPPLHAALRRAAGDGHGGIRRAPDAGRASGAGAPGRRARAVGGRHALRRLRVEGRRHVLDRVVARLEPVRRDDVVVGLDAPDDAAVASLPPGKLLVQSVDAFRSMIDDPWLFGRITANHCLSDLYAMGAEPCSALAIVTIPHGLESKMETLLEDLLSGAVKMLNDGGAALVGGHTSEGAEVQLGLSVSGSIDPDRILRKGGLRPGDRLVLTKPIGTGTLLAADMRGKAKARWVDGAIRAMLQSNREAADAVRAHGGRSCTDVTGFGLLGHLVEMTKASGIDARVMLDAVPILDGAEETAARGLLSSLQPQNVRLRRAVSNVETAGADPRYPLLFDPQTAGGLLAGVPEQRAAACVAGLHALGYTHAAVIGTVSERDDDAPPITIA